MWYIKVSWIAWRFWICNRCIFKTLFKVTFLRFSRTYKNFGWSKMAALTLELGNKMAAFVNKIEVWGSSYEWRFGHCAFLAYPYTTISIDHHSSSCLVCYYICLTLRSCIQNTFVDFKPLQCTAEPWKKVFPLSST